jgi:long-chain acyl-CoA synthetase
VSAVAPLGESSGADLLGLLTAGGVDDGLCVHAGTRRISRPQLVAAAEAVRVALDGLGLPPGARVGVVVPNEPEAVAAWFGTWAGARTLVPLNPRLAPAELERIVAAADVAAFVTTPALSDRLDGVAGPAGAAGDVLVVRLGLRPPDGTGDDPRVALLQLTSGTTGPPTPVPLRHDDVLTMLGMVTGQLRQGTSDADAATRPRPAPNLVPVSQSVWAGIYGVLFALHVRADVVLMPRFEPVSFARLVREHGVRSVALPPAAMVMLVEAGDLHGDGDDAGTGDGPELGGLRWVRSITAPLPPQVARRFHERFGVAVLNCYGQTELGGEVIGWTAADWREHGEAKLGAVGRLHPGVDLEVRTDAGLAGVGEPGELWVRTPATRRAAPGGSLDSRLDADRFWRTGDVGRMDADGFVWIDSRVSDVINRGGLKVFPAEVEQVLRSAPGVRDVAVAGVPDDRLGQVPWAWIVPTDDGSVDADALAAWCRERVSPYKVPVRFVPVDALPRNEVGKVLLRELVARAQP